MKICLKCAGLVGEAGESIAGTPCSCAGAGPTIHPDDPKDDGTKVPAFTYAWMIPYITRVARRHGYAIGVHGSMNRDLDLIAVPWVEGANDPKELIQEICKLTDGMWKDENETPRPHGRKAYTIHFHGAWHFIDISFTPRQADDSAGPDLWRKEPPDMPGMWLAAFWDQGHWWMQTLTVTRPGVPKRANETWWYLGPIFLPNEKG
jgi:hypothetical protein